MLIIWYENTNQNTFSVKIYSNLKKKHENVDSFTNNSRVQFITFASKMSNPSSYLPIVIQTAVAIGFVVLALGLSHMLGPKRKTVQKDENFECGIESQGDARYPVSIKYFLTAILFVLFEVEVIFFYPYAVNFKEMGLQGFIAVLGFVAMFLAGFIYVWRRGAFEWEK
jgi:NADH-quinone oxidoreductase subunit A